MTLVPTAAEAEVLAAIAERGPDFAERARRYDLEASFPHENWDDLTRLGLLGLVVPASAGGLGLDFRSYALVAEEIGSHCGSTALTFNMHTCTFLLAGPIADLLDLSDAERAQVEERRTELWRGAVERGEIHAQPFSEGLAAAAAAGFATTATPTDDGFRVSGRKVFASLSGAADYYNVTCVTPGQGDRVRFLSVPKDVDGLRIDGSWDPLGMRGTVSRTLILDEVEVARDRELIPFGMFDQMAARWPFYYMTLSFCYLGVMRAALDFTRRYLRGEVPGVRGARWGTARKQAGWAEMQIAYERARALAHAVVERAQIDPPPELVRAAWASVYTTMETAPEVCSTALRVCGGQSLMRQFELERLYRDARCGAVMLPWSADIVFERLGRYGLDDDATVAPA